MQNNTTATTYRYERWRALSAGILETAGQTFLLLIAVRHFEAGATAKAIVAAGGSAGLLLTPVVVSRVSTWGWSPAEAAARLAVLGIVGFLIMAAVPTLPVFVVGSVVTMAAASMAVPLMTQIYQDNYPAPTRGKLFSRAVMIRVGMAAAFSSLAGRVLSHHLGWFQALLLFYALAFAFWWFCLKRIPSHPMAAGHSTHPFRAMRFVRDDRVFRLTLICWMLMGFANLMMLPMRVEYLANPRYGLVLSATMVAVLVGVIPNVTRLLLSPLWGLVFDRMNFFALRVVLNIGFAIGILTFFMSSSLPGLIAGAVVFGIANAGGDVAWTLWVTKVAPADHVADYMSVHTFFTGLRGTLAPLVAFHIVGGVSIGMLGAVSAGLILVASVILLGEIRTGKTPDPEATLVENSTVR